MNRTYLLEFPFYLKEMGYSYLEIGDILHKIENPPRKTKSKWEKLFQIRKKECQICGYDKFTEVHHKDKNLGNQSNNLLILCPNCHTEIHRCLSPLTLTSEH